MSARASSKGGQKPTAPPKAAVARFRADLAALTPGDDARRWGLALSGGPDSLALLLLLHSACPDRFVSATVDHGLRPEAAKEAEAMAQLCAAMGIPHAILRLDPAKRSGNTADWARKARYAVLGDWGKAHALAGLMTAHHADDQLETLLMRLNRGAGVSGLAGIRAHRPGVLRPLLGWRKAELEALVRQCGLTPFIDPGNTDLTRDRARLRAALRDVDWLDPLAAVRSAAALEEAAVALDWMAERLAAERIMAKGAQLVLDPEGLPDELRRRLLDHALRRVKPGARLRGGEVDRLARRLVAGETATIAGVRAAGGALWKLTPAPPHRIKRSH